MKIFLLGNVLVLFSDLFSLNFKPLKYNEYKSFLAGGSSGRIKPPKGELRIQSPTTTKNVTFQSKVARRYVKKGGKAN